MYTCGLRPHEARLIQREHLNLSEGTIFNPESKGHKDRIVAMLPEMTNICAKYIPYTAHEFPNSPYLFPCQRFKGAAYNGSWLTKVFHLCWDEAGLGKVSGNAPRPYDFRHSYAVASLRAGDDIKTVQSNLGHHTAAFTLDVYGHVTEEMKRASAERMEKFIQGVSGT